MLPLPRFHPGHAPFDAPPGDARTMHALESPKRTKRDPSVQGSHSGHIAGE